MTKKKGINPLGAAIVGAAMGAGVMALSDKKNREKLAKTAERLKGGAEKLKGSAQEMMNKKKEEFSEMTGERSNDQPGQ